METTSEKFERLRDVGLLEKYSAARHPLGFYLNVAFSVNYTIPETFGLPLKDYVYKAVETLINQHPILSAIPLDEDTDEPYFVRLPEVDLSQPISFQKAAQALTLDEHDSELKSLLEAQHGTGFTAPLPFWRLIVSTDDDSARCFTAVFVYHHALSDGTAGKAFHRTFLQALRGAASLKPGEAKQVVTSPKTPLLPNLEAVHPLPISLPYLLRVVLRECIYSKPDPKLWAGGPIQLPLKTKVCFIVVTAAQTSALIKVCREHSTTVTCALETAIARSILLNLPENFTRITGSVPITQRPWLPDTITDDSMGVFVQEISQPFSRKALTQEAFPWKEAQRARQAVKKEIGRDSKNTSIGLFKYVTDFRTNLCESRIGKTRSVTFELSSVGVVKTENPEDSSIPQMGRVIFTQSASVTGSALEFSLITGQDGCLTLGISWQVNVVEDDMVQAVVDTLRKELHNLSA
ncbi:alcohol acetyltransferase [Aspergillus varians]